jgi:putative ABC transport system permease protein
LYITEDVIGKLSILFTALAIFLASLGLYGLSAFAAEQKTKEIGIRKVLGASRWGIVRLFLQKTNKLIILSIAIAIPITHFLASQWLEGFAYRTSVDIVTYVLSAGLLLLIAIGTVLLHSYKAAMLNPAEILKVQ